MHFVFSIFVKAYVIPYEYGIYSSCLILQTYLSYLQLGSLNAFNRDYPQLIGAKKDEEAKAYRNTVFSFLFFAFLSSLLLVVLVLLFVRKNSDIDSRFVYGFIFCALITALTVIENFGNYRSRIESGFKYASLVTLFELASVFLGFILVRRVGYYAIYITSVIAMLIGIVCYYRYSYADIHVGIDKRLLRSVLLSGLPLFINGLIWTAVNTIDKFVILAFIDTEALGIYGIAQNAFSYMVLIPTAMSQMFYVKMGKIYGATNDEKKLSEIALRYTLVLAAITSTIALVAYYMLPILVDKFMPNYSSGVPSSQILILGLSIYAATMINGNILTIMKKNAAIIRSSLYMCIFNATYSVLFVLLFGAKIEWVALGTATSYTLCAFIIISQVHRYARCSVWDLIRSSVIPVSITIIPGVLIYHSQINNTLGLAISLAIVVFYFGVCGRKSIIEIFKAVD